MSLLEDEVPELAGDLKRNFWKDSKSKRLYCEVTEKSLAGDELSGKYVRLVYDTLRSWQMNRGGGLSPYGTFEKCIRLNRDRILELRGLGLAKIDEREFGAVMGTLGELFCNLELVRPNRPKLVTFSKAMHFMLPDLAVPIDRQFTIKFFFLSARVDYRSFDAFEAAHREFFLFARSHPELSSYVDSGSSPTVCKVIDNLIIRWIKMNGGTNENGK